MADTLITPGSANLQLSSEAPSVTVTIDSAYIDQALLEVAVVDGYNPHYAFLVASRLEAVITDPAPLYALVDHIRLEVIVKAVPNYRNIRINV